MTNGTGWYRIELSYACFGVFARNGVIKWGAPIGAWMVGKDIPYIERWVQRRDGKIQKLTSKDVGASIKNEKTTTQSNNKEQ